MAAAPPVLEVRGITKRFPGVLANDNITLSLRKGEVLGLLGENGAGKSTLMNLIYGLYKPDQGEIRVNGQVVDIAGPKDAIQLGIGMVHQHFQLVDVLTVTENVMLGNETVSGPFLRRDRARREILELSQEYGLDVNPDALISDLPVGIQQRGGNHQSPLPPRRHPHPRRADGGADAAGNAGACSRLCVPCSPAASASFLSAIN